jgi:hypothetical protein
MNCLDMPRRPKNFLLDERVIEALGDAAKRAGYKNANQFVEATLFSLLKMSGSLPPDAEPLPEARGGKRSGAGKPKAQPTAESQDVRSEDGEGGSDE